MKCPICKQEMKLAGSDESHNFKTRTIYIRKVYVCKGDDVWVTTELPTSKQANSRCGSL